MPEVITSKVCTFFICSTPVKTFFLIYSISTFNLYTLNPIPLSLYFFKNSCFKIFCYTNLTISFFAICCYRRQGYIVQRTCILHNVKKHRSYFKLSTTYKSIKPIIKVMTILSQSKFSSLITSKCYTLFSLLRSIYFIFLCNTIPF